MNGLEDVVALVRAGRRFLVTGHANPDGDALGSMLATMHGLRALGKEVVAYDHDPAPRRLAFLPGADALVTDATKLGEPFDATFVHDCGDEHLLGDRFPSRAVTGPLVVVDHHASGRAFGDVALRDTSASAVGIIVARLLTALGVRLDKTIAECLWCSLVSDTGWFRYSSTDVETMRLGTACVEAGAVPWDFARRSEETQPPARLTLMARLFDTLEIVGAVALLTLARSTLAATGTTTGEAEGLVSYARALDGVEVGVMLYEADDGVRVSLRSKGAVDVGAVAASLGGGGHRAAAGCFVRGTLADARAIVLDKLAHAGAA
ncbi:MAG TPA: DHH family phosphoesterase [Polyangia bacterium]|jgi:phosphoesterase RecJ-like protein|nr:DHH family phosphoesterase [Polyangia bacterium]